MSVLPGCIHVHRKAPVSPPEVAEHIQFPEWGKDAVTVSGPHTAQGSPDEWARCLQRLENYDAWIKRGEGATFIHFTPKEDERCGLAPSPVDVGASYAISDEGVILKRE
ncbi:hypothetical protein F0U61_10440 [Archangium violaceum]|uniref:hypothetical protein n=1 Tax=Archangium violaceum TaxID=83451 RepID=UPI002B324410|nr:hypothetical protein F0U61_10440 [Archangium violaceum]